VDDVTRLRLLAYLRGSCVPVWNQCDEDSLVAALRCVALCGAGFTLRDRHVRGLIGTMQAHSQKCEKRPSASSVRPSVRTEQLGLHWAGFHEIWYSSIFRKLVEKIHISLKSGKNGGSFTRRPICIFFIVSRSVLRMRNNSDKRCRENQNTQFMFNTFFKKNHAVYDIMWETYFRGGHATRDSMAHAHCVLCT